MQQVHEYAMAGDEPIDGGTNCWDCGATAEDEDMNMCSQCRVTICWDCQGGVMSSYSSPHTCGMEQVI
jgi:hypothetical protein